MVFVICCVFLCQVFHFCTDVSPPFWSSSCRTLKNLARGNIIISVPESEILVVNGMLCDDLWGGECGFFRSKVYFLGNFEVFVVG